MKRIFVFFAGALTAFILLEGVLNLGGVVYQTYWDLHTRSAVKEAGIKNVILCLGNSYTKGVGAAPEMSYPMQLQQMLNRSTNNNSLVINKGVGLQSTAELLSSLKFNIKLHRPNLIVLQTGQCNRWNYSLHTNYLRRVEGTFSVGSRFRNLFIELYFKCKVFKLFKLCHAFRKLMKARCLNGHLVDNSYRASEQYQELTALIREINVKKGLLSLGQHKYETMINFFADKIRIDPGCSLNYTFIGYIYRFQQNYEEALKWFMKGVIVDAELGAIDEFNEGYKEIRNMRKTLKGAHNDEINKRIDEFIIQFDRKNPDKSYNFLQLENSEIDQWIESDLKEIVRIVRHEGVGIVLQNYPMAEHENLILSRIASELNLPFVDNQAVFDGLMAKGVPWNELFVPDCHCNAKGYGIMAENVYNKLMAAGLLK